MNRWRTMQISEKGVAGTGALLVGWALLVLLVAYVAICLHTRSAWPWHIVVHEDGVRTLLQTLLYYDHATRELPIDLLLGIAIGASVAFALPGDGARIGAAGLGLMLAGTVAVIIGGALAKGGVQMVIENLMQQHTRAGAPLVWGSHWRYHLLERGPMMLAALGFGGLICALTGRSAARRGMVATLTAATLFLVLTLVFTPSAAALRLPFFDARFLGHQAREIFTHGLVTIPLALGVVLLVRRGAVAPPDVPLDPARFRWPLMAIAAGIGLMVYVLIGAIVADAAAQGQSGDLVTLLVPHFFEHGFTYLVTPLVAALTWVLCCPRR